MLITRKENFPLSRRGQLRLGIKDLQKITSSESAKKWLSVQKTGTDGTRYGVMDIGQMSG